MGSGQHIIVLLIFAFGVLMGVGVASHPSSDSPENGLIEQPSELESADQGSTTAPTMADLLLKFEALQNEESVKEDKDVPSPHDWISMDNIQVYDNQVIITLPHPEWARYLDTNSMDPVIDSNANTIQIVPTEEGDVHVGDIVAYESKYHEGIITHRVVETGEDAQGWYAILKGDNNPKQDPGKIRFSQIRRVVVAVIY